MNMILTNQPALSAYAIPGLKIREKLNQRHTMESISKVVAYELQIEFGKLFTKSRKREYVLGRQISMFLIRKNHCGVSLTSMAAYFGGRDHTTAIHSINTIKNEIQNDEWIRSVVSKIENEL